MSADPFIDQRFNLIGNQSVVFAVVKILMMINPDTWQNNIGEQEIIGYFSTEEEAERFIMESEYEKDCMAPARDKLFIIKI